MLLLRSLRWPEDRDAICALDTSFTTGHVYRVTAAAAAFTLREASVTPPLHKVYHLTGEVDRFPTFDYVLIADLHSQAVGVAALSFDEENQRAILRHLYVDRSHRGQGVGSALLEAMVSRARQAHMRCIWLETQDINYPAIQLYRRAGFEWAGLDLSLDEHDGSAADETAVFFMRNLREH